MEMQYFARLMGTNSFKVYPKLCKLSHYKLLGYTRVSEGDSEVLADLGLSSKIEGIAVPDEYAGMCLRVFEALESKDILGVLSVCDAVYNTKYATFNIQNIQWFNGLIKVLQMAVCRGTEDVEFAESLQYARVADSLSSAKEIRSAFYALRSLSDKWWLTQELQKFLTKRVGKLIYDYNEIEGNAVAKVLLFEYAKQYENVFGTAAVDKVIGSNEWRNKVMERRLVKEDRVPATCIILFVIGIAAFIVVMYCYLSYQGDNEFMKSGLFAWVGIPLMFVPGTLGFMVSFMEDDRYYKTKYSKFVGTFVKAKPDIFDLMY